MIGFLLSLGFTLSFIGNFLLQESLSKWLDGEPRLRKLGSPLKKILPSALFLIFAVCAAAMEHGEIGQYALQGAVIFQITVFVGVWAIFWKASSVRTGDPAYPQELLERLPDEKNQLNLLRERIKTQLSFRTLLMIGSITLYSVFSLNGFFGVFEGAVLLIFGILWLIWMDIREKDRSRPNILPLLDAHAIPELEHTPLEKTALHKFFSEKLGVLGLAPFITVGLVSSALGCWLLITGVQDLTHGNTDESARFVIQFIGVPFCLFPVILQALSYKTIGINLGLIFDRIVLLLSFFAGLAALISPAEISPLTLSWDFPFMLILANLLGLFLLTGRPPSHKVGILLVILYFAYSTTRWI